MIYSAKKQAEDCQHSSYARSNIISNRSLSYQSSPSSSDSSSGSRKYRFVVPLAKKNWQHNNNIQETLRILQHEVESLKHENERKDILIKNLQAQIGHEPADNSDRINHTHHPRRDRNEAVKSGFFYSKIFSPDRPLNNPFRHISTSRSSQLDNDCNYGMSQPPLSTHNGPRSRSSRYMKKCRSPARALSHVTEIENQIKMMNAAKNERIEFLVAENEHYKKIYQELETKLAAEVSENDWIKKFCKSFIKMASSVAQVEGHEITNPEWSLRKNARSCWKFLKEFIAEVIE